MGTEGRFLSHSIKYYTLFRNKKNLFYHFFAFFLKIRIRYSPANHFFCFLLFKTD